MDKANKKTGEGSEAEIGIYLTRGRVRGTVVDPFFGSHLWTTFWRALGFHLHNQVVQFQTDLAIAQKDMRSSVSP